ncbi:hypothetical protein AB0K15_35365 [Amycolatopsis sp. NPDC049253]|uniref:hypothetical protein n=1 Tax=Amycolatopsis sp. NPDC049253 TaxID=3155274 RepID=UPI0034445D9C
MALTRHRPPSPRPRRTAVAGKPRAAQAAASAVDVVAPVGGPDLAAEAAAPESDVESPARGAAARGADADPRGRAVVGPDTAVESPPRDAVVPGADADPRSRAAVGPDSDVVSTTRGVVVPNSDTAPPSRAADTTDAEELSAEPTEEPATAGPGKPRRSPVTIGLSALAVVLLATAGWFAFQAHRSTTSGPAANTAFSDSAATSAVTGQLSAAFESVFSLDYQDVAKTQRAADQYLTGNAVTQYRQLLSAVQQQAVPHHLTLTSRVRTIGIKDITGTTAHVLVFADQTTSRAGTPDTSSGGAQVRLTATEDNGHWRISDIEVL